MYAAERILNAVRNLSCPELPEGRGITVSIGIASLPENECETKDKLIALADLAMYDAKHQGRDRIAFAPPRTSSSED